MKLTYRLGLLLAISGLLFVTSNSILAQQPYVGCWHPEDIREWAPATDRDAVFNRAKVPLAKRAVPSVSMRANSNQFAEGGITDASIVGPMCSALPSQGMGGFIQYQPTYWQYMDKFVHWAGSASEGIIIPPPAPTVDAAHAQGVKVLGQIFFPPKAFGGKSEWVTEMLTEVDGHFPYARKLFEIATYFGFDGWFINEETNGGTSSKWKDFIEDFYAVAAESGDNNVEIQWYNASTQPNLRILGTNRRTSQFLEYGSTKDQTSWATQITYADGSHPEHIFDILYSGIECVQSGLTNYGMALKRVFTSTGHVGSVALFCPEEHSWRDNVRDLLNTPSQAYGEVAWNATKKTFENERKMWVNTEGNPSIVSSTSWPGISGCILERTAITSLPFVSHMTVGVGKNRYEAGQIVAKGEWCHTGMQSILPTWRWWIENGDGLSTTIDWDDAWNGGSSFKIHGKLSAGDHLVRLYKTTIENKGKEIKAKLVYRGNITPTLELSTKESVNPDISLEVTKEESINGWKCAEYVIPSNVDDIYMIGVNMKVAAELTDFSFSLAEFSMFDGDETKDFAISNLENQTELGVEGGDLRLTWESAWSPVFDHFNIYVTDETGKRTLSGQTRDDAYYISGLVRKNNDSYLDVEVVPVMFDGEHKESLALRVNYPTPAVPDVTFEVSKSYIAIGESTTLSMYATGAATSYRWDLPSGLNPRDGIALDNNEIEVIGTKEGAMEVEGFATNNIGTGSCKKELVDVYKNENELNCVTNVALNKKIVEFSNCTNNNEHPRNLLDGIKNPTSVSAKWCSTDQDNYVIIDLGETFRLYGIRIYDGNYGPESGVPQVESYTVSLSEDGDSFHPVLNRKGAEEESVKDVCFAPEYGRFMRLDTHTNGVLRIWELEVLGSKYGMTAVEEITTESDLKVTGCYSLTGHIVEGNYRGPKIVRYSDGSAKLIL